MLSVARLPRSTTDHRVESDWVGELQRLGQERPTAFMCAERLPDSCASVPQVTSDERGSLR